MTRTFLCVAAVLILGGPAGSVLGQPETSRELPAPVAAQDAALVEKGRYLVAAGDCMACHTRKDGAAFAGGRVIDTPFGKVASANLTPDPTGLKGWTADDFYKALHTGVSKKVGRLYPAFPYNYYTRITRADSDAIFAYLQSIPAVEHDPRRNRLPFPFNIRQLMIAWNWLFLDKGAFEPDPTKSAAWNRGAYLVEGLGHCGACHTPKNLLGGPKEERRFHGGAFADWFAPDLTSHARTGLGSWSADEIALFLETGANDHAIAAGEMGEVVAFSTSKLSASDRAAIVTYLRDLPPSPDADPPKLRQEVLAQGEAIFQDQCSACHKMDGSGVPGFFPPLKGSANLQQSDPTNAVRFVLAGVRATPMDVRPTPLAMPPFAWKLTDDQIAAVITYARNSWGNQASAVDPGDVADLRKKLVPKEGQRPPPTDHHLDGPARPSTWSQAG